MKHGQECACCFVSTKVRLCRGDPLWQSIGSFEKVNTTYLIETYAHTDLPRGVRLNSRGILSTGKYKMKFLGVIFLNGIFFFHLHPNYVFKSLWSDLTDTESID